MKETHKLKKLENVTVTLEVVDYNHKVMTYEMNGDLILFKFLKLYKEKFNKLYGHSLLGAITINNDTKYFAISDDSGFGFKEFSLKNYLLDKNKHWVIVEFGYKRINEGEGNYNKYFLKITKDVFNEEELDHYLVQQ